MLFLHYENKRKQIINIERCTHFTYQLFFLQTEKLNMRLYNILISIVILILFSAFALAQNPNFSYPYNYTRKAFVSRVIDGDTFVLSDSQHVRMLCINTPDLWITGKPSEPFSDSAYYFTKSLIEGKFIKLTFDGKAFDIFGRLLAYTWLTDVNGKDSLFIQA